MHKLSVAFAITVIIAGDASATRSLTSQGAGPSQAYHIQWLLAWPAPILWSWLVSASDSLMLPHTSVWVGQRTPDRQPSNVNNSMSIFCAAGAQLSSCCASAHRSAGDFSWNAHDGIQPLLTAEALSVGVAAVESTARNFGWRRSLLSAVPARAARLQNGAGSSAVRALQGRTLAQSAGLPAAAVEAPQAEPTPKPTGSPLQQGNFGFSINNNVAFVGGESLCVCGRHAETAPLSALKPKDC